MAYLVEKIYEYLKEQDKAMSIGEINSSKGFTDISRRALAQELQQMERQNDLFRTLKEGKAYYSVTNESAVQQNRVRDGIKNLQVQLNKEANGMSENVIFEESSDDKTLKPANISITYLENKEVSCEKYTMKIPDGFEIIEESGRDFVAYLPNPNMEGYDYNMGGAYIQILPSYETPLKLEREFCLPECYSAVYESVYWSGIRSSMEAIFGEIEYFPIVVDTTSGGVMHTQMGESHHYYVMFHMRDGYKQIHFQIDNLFETEEKTREFVVQMANKFTLKNPIERFKKLNSEYFVNKPLTDKLAKEWVDLLNQIYEEQNMWLNLYVNAVEQSRISVEQSEGTYSELKLKQRIRLYVKSRAEMMNRTLETVVDYISKVKTDNLDNPALFTIIDSVKERLDENKVISVEIAENEKIDEVAAMVANVKEYLCSEDIKQVVAAREKKIEEEKQKKLQEFTRKIQRAKNVKNMVYAANGSYFIITPDGDVISGGSNTNLACLTSLWKNIVQIAGGDKHIVGLKEDGTVVAVGDNYFGQCNVGSWTNIVSIAAGYNHTVGLRKDGTVVAVGNKDTSYNYRAQSSKSCCEVENWKDIIAITAGSNSTVGLKKDGKVIVVGDCCKPSVDYSSNEYRAKNIENWPPVVEIAAHDAAVYGITEKGDLVTTAIHIRGEKWKNIVSIFAPFNGNTELVAVRKDGSVVGYWGRRKDWEIEFKQYGNVIYAVGETAYNDNANVLCLRMDGTFAGNPSGGFMNSLKGVKLFNNPDTIHQEKVEKIKKEIESTQKMIAQKKDELANTKGLFSGGKKKALQAEINQLENKLAKLKAKVDE